MKMKRIPILILFPGLCVTAAFAQGPPSKEEIAMGERVYLNKCGRCDSLRKTEGARSSWKELIARERARDPHWLTDNEAGMLLIYLENARR